MGLLSSMKKITSFTNRIVNLTNGSQTGTNLPTNAVTRALGISEELGFGSLEEIKESISEISGTVNKGYTMVRCAVDLFTTGAGLDFLYKLASGIDNAIQSVIDEIFDAVATQVSLAAQQVIGAVTNLIDSLLNLVNSILLIAESLKELYDSWTNWEIEIKEWQYNKEQCADMYASIAACLLNKLLGPYLDKFTEKVTGKINEIGNDFNNKLYDELQDVNTFSSYANQEAFLLKKASIQMKGLTKENLLGVE